MLTVKQLTIYPVKSLRGFSVNSALLTQTGLQYDRFCMIIDKQNRFVTQRKFSDMILIHTVIKDRLLILHKPSDIKLEPLSLAIDKTPIGPSFFATVWKDRCEVQDEGEAASEWLHRALPDAQDLHLVRMKPNTLRPQSKPELLGETTHTLFSDAAPLLIANTRSLAALNNHLQTQAIDAVTMERFRPHIVIDGLQAFEEHQVKKLHHANYDLTLCYPCQRCVIPTIDLNSGKRHPQQQPFSLLADINAMPDNTKAPAFGENAILTRGDGQTIAIGDRLSVLSQS